MTKLQATLVLPLLNRLKARPGVRPIHFHFSRAILFILIAVALALFAGKEFGVLAIAYRTIELVCEILADRVFPVSIGS